MVPAGSLWQKNRLARFDLLLQIFEDLLWIAEDPKLNSDTMRWV